MVLKLKQQKQKHTPSVVPCFIVRLTRAYHTSSQPIVSLRTSHIEPIKHSPRTNENLSQFPSVGKKKKKKKPKQI